MLVQFLNMEHIIATIIEAAERERVKREFLEAIIKSHADHVWDETEKKLRKMPVAPQIPSLPDIIHGD